VSVVSLVRELRDWETSVCQAAEKGDLKTLNRLFCQKKMNSVEQGRALLQAVGFKRDVEVMTTLLQNGDGDLDDTFLRACVVFAKLNGHLSALGQALRNVGKLPESLQGY
jgi:hypothetical protein